MQLQLLLALGGMLLVVAPAHAQKQKVTAVPEEKPVQVEARGTLQLEEKTETDLDALRRAYPRGTGAYLKGGSLPGLELYLGGDRKILEKARELKGKAVVVSGTPLYVFPPEGLQRLTAVTLPPRLVIRVTGIRAAGKE